MGNMLAFIRGQNPDILALQEVYNGHDASWEKRFRTLDVLAETFGYRYVHFAPAFLDIIEDKRIEQGNAVLSKFPIVSSDIAFYDTPYSERMFDVADEEERLRRNFTTPRNLQHVELDIGQASVHVFNTQGIWGVGGEDNERRLHMVDTICAKVNGKENSILCGDFNLQLEGTRCFEALEGSGVRSIFKGELASTFNMRQKDPGSGYAAAIVDGIFVSPGIRVVQKECPNVDVTDHLPLVALLEV